MKTDFLSKGMIAASLGVALGLVVMLNFNLMMIWDLVYAISGDIVTIEGVSTRGEIIAFNIVILVFSVPFFVFGLLYSVSELLTKNPRTGTIIFPCALGLQCIIYGLNPFKYIRVWPAPTTFRSPIYFMGFTVIVLSALLAATIASRTRKNR